MASTGLWKSFLSDLSGSKLRKALRASKKMEVEYSMDDERQFRYPLLFAKLMDCLRLSEWERMMVALGLDRPVERVTLAP